MALFLTIGMTLSYMVIRYKKDPGCAMLRALLILWCFYNLAYVVIR